MSALGRAVACLGLAWQGILLDDDHPIDVIGENARGHQTGHSRPEHHRLPRHAIRRNDRRIHQENPPPSATARIHDDTTTYSTCYSTIDVATLSVKIFGGILGLTPRNERGFTAFVVRRIRAIIAP